MIDERTSEVLSTFRGISPPVQMVANLENESKRSKENDLLIREDQNNNGPQEE